MLSERDRWGFVVSGIHPVWNHTHLRGVGPTKTFISVLLQREAGSCKPTGAFTSEVGVISQPHSQTSICTAGDCRVQHAQRLSLRFKNEVGNVLAHTKEIENALIAVRRTRQLLLARQDQRKWKRGLSGLSRHPAMK